MVVTSTARSVLPLRPRAQPPPPPSQGRTRGLSCLAVHSAYRQQDNRAGDGRDRTDGLGDRHSPGAAEQPRSLKRRSAGAFQPGALLEEYPGTYRVGHRAASTEATYMAAVKACGDGTLLCGRAAAWLWGSSRVRHRRPKSSPSLRDGWTGSSRTARGVSRAPTPSPPRDPDHVGRAHARRPRRGARRRCPCPGLPRGRGEAPGPRPARSRPSSAPAGIEGRPQPAPDHGWGLQGGR